MLLHRLALVSALSFAALAPAAAGVVAPAPLSQADHADIARIETYLNGLKTLTARFIQLSDAGQIANGTVYLSRPGKLRFEYDPPTPILMVTHGDLLVYRDNAMNETSYIPLSSTPLDFILRAHVAVGGDLIVTEFRRQADVIEMTLREAGQPDQGALTLTFADKPLELKQWTVVDQQRKSTTVTLEDARVGVQLADSLFEFDDPRLTANPQR